MIWKKEKVFIFMAQLLQSGLKNSVWKTKVIITGNQSKGKYVKRRKKKQEDTLYEKPELSLWQAIRAKGNMWNQASYNSKQKYANCFKRGKTRVTKSLLVLGLNLIGWKMAARSFWTNYTAKWNKLKQSRIYFPHSNENSSDSKEKQNIIKK